MLSLWQLNCLIPAFILCFSVAAFSTVLPFCNLSVILGAISGFFGGFMKNGISVFWLLLALTGAIVFGTLLAGCSDESDLANGDLSGKSGSPGKGGSGSGSDKVEKPDPEKASELYDKLRKVIGENITTVISLNKNNATLTVLNNISITDMSKPEEGNNIYGPLSNGTGSNARSIAIGELTIPSGVKFEVNSGVKVTVENGAEIIVESATQYAPGHISLKSNGTIFDVKGKLTVTGAITVGDGAEMNVTGTGEIVFKDNKYRLDGPGHITVKSGGKALRKIGNAQPEIICSGDDDEGAFKLNGTSEFWFAKDLYALDGNDITFNGIDDGAGKGKKGFTVVAGQTMTIYGKLSMPDNVTLDVKGTVRLVHKDGDGQDRKTTQQLIFTKTIITGGATDDTVKTILDGNGRMATIAGAGSGLTVDGRVELLNNAKLIIGDGDNTVEFTSAATTTTNPATINGGKANGEAGTLELVNNDSIGLVATSKIVVNGDSKVILPNTEFGAGTYTVNGDVTINAKTRGDEIVTSTIAGNGLILGSAATALSLLTQGATVATYTFVAGGTASEKKKIVLGNGASAITVGNNDTQNAFKVKASATANIVLGTGNSIKLGNGAILELATGAKIGMFTDNTKITLGPNKTGASLGGAILTKNTGSLVDASGTLTATTATVTLTGAADGNSAISAEAVFVEGT
jgi:hypothetical protein